MCRLAFNSGAWGIIVNNNVMYFVLKPIQVSYYCTKRNTVYVCMHTHKHTMTHMQHKLKLSTLFSFQNATFKEVKGKTSMNSEGPFHWLETGRILQKTVRTRNCIMVDWFSPLLLEEIGYAFVTFILSSKTSIV